MLQRIAQSGFDEARKFLLLNLIETYFELGAEEMKRFRHLLSKEGYREAQEMEVTWADKIDMQSGLDSLWSRCEIWELTLHVATFLTARRRIAGLQLLTTGPS